MFIFTDPTLDGRLFALHHPIKLQALKAVIVWLFYFGPLLTLPWLAWLFHAQAGKIIWRTFTPELRLLFVVCVTTYFSCMLTIYPGQPHYVAPLAAVFYAIMLLMMRDLYHAKFRSIGREIHRTIRCSDLWSSAAGAYRCPGNGHDSEAELDPDLVFAG